MSYNVYTDRHKAVASWFLGPRGENFDHLLDIFGMVLDTQKRGRAEYYPQDQPFITQDIKNSKQFQESIQQLKGVVKEVSALLTKHSVPFWNPRYNAHMLMDTTLAGIAGYMMAMIFNPNNVAIEASPITTILERDVGRQLCGMVGIDEKKGWGHITCDGSIANLESIWAARNMKFYPLSLTLAMENGPLGFLRSTFKLATCEGIEKLFSDFTTWELLNIRADDILDIPDRICQQYMISPAFLQRALNKYLVQSTPRDDPIFSQRFGKDGIDLSKIALITSTTKHYSWPKGAAITGIGSNNIVEILVDFDARMDIYSLREELEECLENKRAVYAVIAIMGSTEHGACDPLKDIVDLLNEFENKGLSFAIHADGAWGTYYHTILNTPPALKASLMSKSLEIEGYVPSMSLKPKTEEGLLHLRYCETITVDPHKSGYVQYPAGGLLYRDGRMRHLITWESPVIFRPEEESMGVYGVEGSKPGASPTAVWLSNKVIGLHQDGYGALLGEGIFGAVKMYCYLATMSLRETDFRVTTLTRLPAEVSGGNVEAQKKFILRRILNISNLELVKDIAAMNLIKEMGSDLSINAFAVNFRANGKINEDVAEANDLNKRIFQRLSVTSKEDDVNTRPLFLTSTQLQQSTYKTCLDNFKQRLGLVGYQDLYTLINVVSSPFPTDANFTGTIASALRQVISEEVMISQVRNTVAQATHGFIIQGMKKRVHLVYVPMFNMASHRYQLIITGELPEDVLEKYITERKNHSEAYFTLSNTKPAVLKNMIKERQFDAVINVGIPPKDGNHLISSFSITNIEVVLEKKLDYEHLKKHCENTIPFYLYGTNDELHITHALHASPSIQLIAEGVTFDPIDPTIPSEQPNLHDEKGPSVFILHIHYPEAAMQPFPPNTELARIDSKFFFHPGAVLPVSFTHTVELGEEVNEQPQAILRLADKMFIDTDMLQMDPKSIPSTPTKGHAKEMLYDGEAAGDKDGNGTNGEVANGPVNENGVGNISPRPDGKVDGLANGNKGERNEELEAKTNSSTLTSASPPGNAGELVGSFTYYSWKGTMEHPRIPLLRDKELSISESFLTAIQEAVEVGN